jgi:hypothetical protein
MPASGLTARRTAGSAVLRLVPRLLAAPGPSASIRGRGRCRASCPVSIATAVMSPVVPATAAGGLAERPPAHLRGLRERRGLPDRRVPSPVPVPGLWISFLRLTRPTLRRAGACTRPVAAFRIQMSDRQPVDPPPRFPSSKADRRRQGPVTTHLKCQRGQEIPARDVPEHSPAPLPALRPALQLALRPAGRPPLRQRLRHEDGRGRRRGASQRWSSRRQPVSASRRS